MLDFLGQRRDCAFLTKDSAEMPENRNYMERLIERHPGTSMESWLWVLPVLMPGELGTSAVEGVGDNVLKAKVCNTHVPYRACLYVLTEGHKHSIRAILVLRIG